MSAMEEVFLGVAYLNNSFLALNMLSIVLIFLDCLFVNYLLGRDFAKILLICKMALDHEVTRKILHFLSHLLSVKMLYGSFVRYCGHLALLVNGRDFYFRSYGGTTQPVARGCKILLGYTAQIFVYLIFFRQR
jgi:hypothetical protein